MNLTKDQANLHQIRTNITGPSKTMFRIERNIFKGHLRERTNRRPSLECSVRFAPGPSQVKTWFTTTEHQQLSKLLRILVVIAQFSGDFCWITPTRKIHVRRQQSCVCVCFCFSNFCVILCGEFVNILLFIVYITTYLEYTSNYWMDLQ